MFIPAVSNQHESANVLNELGKESENEKVNSFVLPIDSVTWNGRVRKPVSATKQQPSTNEQQSNAKQYGRQTATKQQRRSVLGEYNRKQRCNKSKPGSDKLKRLGNNKRYVSSNTARSFEAGESGIKYESSSDAAHKFAG